MVAKETKKILRITKRGKHKIKPPHQGVPNPHFEAKNTQTISERRKIISNHLTNSRSKSTIGKHCSVLKETSQ